ncbi:helix-turn-helix domain-containing protein [Pseudonocardia alni]|uniref:helix-turn-helix domain-containing protein n=1 Tax=Pseudonocardia alni TaxID=33907 RepID=UPI00280C13E2|nr:helix-turn-helix transcriptional regulator [Pseudonocardia alni]
MTGPGFFDTSDPPSNRLSPAAARRRLGAELRELRTAAGLRLSDVGQRLERSQATVSRLENGTTPARAVDIEMLLNLYADRIVVEAGRRELILDLLADSRRQEWFKPYRDVINSDMTDEHVGTYMEYESYAAALVSYEPDLVPGLLQTPEYAAAVVAVYFPGHDERRRERLVQLRMLRKDHLDKENPLEIDVILGEGALRRQFGSIETRAAQLEAIASEINRGRRTVRVRIVPATLALPAAIGGPFVVMTFQDDRDQDIVYIEGRAGATYLRNSDEVETYQKQFASLAAAALDDDSALAFIAEMIDSLS